MHFFWKSILIFCIVLIVCIFVYQRCSHNNRNIETRTISQSMKNNLNEIAYMQSRWAKLIDSIKPAYPNPKVMIKSLSPYLKGYIKKHKNILWTDWLGLHEDRVNLDIYSSAYCNSLYIYFFDIDDSLPPERGLRSTAYIRSIQKNTIFSLELYSMLGIHKGTNICEALIRDTFEIEKEVCSENTIKSLYQKYQNNINVLKNNDNIKLSKKHQKNMLRDFNYRIRSFKSATAWLKQTVIASVILQLLQETQIKAIASIQVFDEKNFSSPIGNQYNYSRIPVKLNLALDYSQLKELIQKINDSDHLIYVGLIAVNNDRIRDVWNPLGPLSSSQLTDENLKEMEETYKNKSLFENAKCEIVIEFVTSLGENKVSQSKSP